MNRRDFLKLLPGSLTVILPGITQAASNTDIKAATTTQQTLLQHQPLAGYPYYQADNVWAELRIDDELEMRREPDNRRDTRAIAIYWRKRKLGYVPRDQNTDLAQRIDQGEKLQARIIGLKESDDPTERIEMGFYRVDKKPQPQQPRKKLLSLKQGSRS